MAWIFRSATPIADRVRDATSDEWPVEQHHSLMTPGDIVFLWEGGADGRIVGVGRIQTQPYRRRDDMRKTVVRVGHNLPLREPLSARECRADPLLQNLPILGRDDQTNYGLSRAHADRLLAVLARREGRLAAALNLPPERIPALAEPLPQSTSTPAPKPAPEKPPEGPFPSDMAERVRAFREEPLNARLLALRRLAYDRVRKFLTPEVLAEAVAVDFEREVARLGAVVIDGQVFRLGEGLQRLGALSPAEIERMAREDRLTTQGNLTWGPDGSPPEESVDPEEAAAASLRLRAGLSHLLSEQLPLTSRIGHMRRSVPTLWPVTATGILMILHPDEHIVFHHPAIEALRVLGIRRTFRDTFDDYRQYRDTARLMMEAFGFASLDEVDLFLVRTADPRWPLPNSLADPPASAADAEAASADPPAPATDPEAAEIPERREEVSNVPSKQAPPAPARDAAPNEGQAVFALYQHLRHSSVVIDLEQVINVYLSLKTTPMMVLDGPSGVGKNLLLRRMAAAMGARFYWMPMSNESGTGPADAPLRLRDLLGQSDARAGTYRPELWYEALVYASQHPGEAVVTCLDTLDGWQEDSWLSEYVRVQDSRAPRADGRWETDPLIVAPGLETLTTADGRTLPAQFPLPDNAFLVMTSMGTIGLGNIAVEHASVIALSPPDLSLDALRPGHAPEVVTPRGLGEILVAQRPYRTLDSILDRPWIEEWNAEVQQIAAIMDDADLPIGYRLRDDVLRYLAYADDLNAQLPYGASLTLESAFDHQLAQRVVTRLLLKEPDDEALTELLMYAQGEQGHGPRFPRTGAYLEALQRRME